MNISDPLKAYKFAVEIDGHLIGLMKIEGLAGQNRGGGYLTLTRGFTSTEPYLREWANHVGQSEAVPPRNIKIVVDSELTLTYMGSRPHGLYFSALDAGGDNNHIFTESLEVGYDRMTYDY